MTPVEQQENPVMDPASYTNINDLDLFSFKEEGIDPNALASDTVPPPPSRDAQGNKIIYTIKLKHAVNAAKDKLEKIIASGGVLKEGGGADPRNVALAQTLQTKYGDNNVSFYRDNAGNPRAMITLEHVIADDQPGAGSRRTDWHSCLKNRTNTSEVHTLAALVLGQDVSTWSDGRLIDMLYMATNAEASYRATIEWRGEVPDPKDNKKRISARFNGKLLNKMENFPQDDNGNYKPVATDDAGAEVRTVWVIDEYQR